MKRTNIRHQELITVVFLHEFNELRIITYDDHLTNIEKQRAITRVRVNKERRIIVIRCKTSINDNRGEVLKSG
jgi:hypothetical protein